MLGVTHHRSDRAEEKSYRLRWPESGGIRIILEAILLYHLVMIATPILVKEIAVMNPAIVPEPFTTILHGVLWLGMGAIVVWVYRSESLVSTHRFDERTGVTDHLERDLPDRRRILQYVGLVVSGGALSWVTYERFVATFLNVIDLLVIVVEEFQWSITVVDGLFTIGFLVGFVLFSLGVDRLVVGWLRWTIQHQYESY